MFAMAYLGIKLIEVTLIAHSLARKNTLIEHSLEG